MGAQEDAHRAARGSWLQPRHESVLYADIVGAEAPTYEGHVVGGEVADLRDIMLQTL